VTEPQNPLDRFLDLMVFAPLGLALEARDLLPKLAEKGRQQVQGQLTVARIMGEFAVKEGQKEADKVVQRVRQQGQDLFSGLRLLAGAPPPAPARTAETPRPVVAPAAPVNGQARASARAAAQALAIPGYDSLSASQVVQRLEGLSGDELEAVRAYEESGRGRKTILAKVAQLQAAS
jgi:hypothetical protein